ncbi:AarF/ABC1/UbiB kinase family protein [Bacillus salacetis]|uniref:AarF/ABC1/UbiB kinase family protein n=1 Tax=Bacillus salacetis TaxID=2315464 RepID=A0A3A1RBX1_9BACI|nr:AarF/UbiB family protein [Bacillus salacetis]RIW38923.1 AarF/ABC1/UbiB kinase family protein [Bacillus salacetis]
MKNKRWYRMWKVLSLAFWIFIKVYWYQITRKPAADREKLWEQVGIRFRDTLFELEGLLIKIGQLLSIRADIMPKGFIRQIGDLVDKVPPAPWEEIKEVLQSEWGSLPEDVLQHIETEAVASASIGEVFKGRTKNGREVAIKVQRPSIESIVQTDFRSLSIIIWFARHFAPVPKGFINFKLLYKELKEVIERELDFVKEGENAERFKERFKELSFVKIPEFHEELSTSKVIVMEWVEGVRITEGPFTGNHLIDREKLARQLIRLFLPQWLESGLFHADPHSGNVLLKEDGTIILLDFGMVGEITKRDADHLQSMVEAVLVKNYEKASRLLLELGFLLPGADLKLIERMLREFLSMDLANFKEMDLMLLKKEMNDLVRSLPIQVPTRFVFLGRSFATIEGLLYNIAPEKEILDLAGPVFMEWLRENGMSKWQFALKWLGAQPFMRGTQYVTDLLEAPKRMMDQKEMLQIREFQFTLLENQKKRSSHLLLAGITGVIGGLYLKEDYIWVSSAVISILAAIRFWIVDWRQKKWLKYIKIGNKDCSGQSFFFAGIPLADDEILLERS